MSGILPTSFYYVIRFASIKPDTTRHFNTLYTKNVTSVSFRLPLTNSWTPAFHNLPTRVQFLLRPRVHLAEL